MDGAGYNFNMGPTPNPSTSYGNGWTYNSTTQEYVNNTDGRRLSQGEYNRQIAAESAQVRADAELKRKNEELARQGLNPDGSPIRKDWQSLLDPKTGKLKDGYTMNISGLDPTQWEGYSKYKQEALRSGPSAWATLQNQSQGVQEMAQKEQAARQSLSGMNQANSGLAMRGGLSAGARGLAARAGQRDLLNSRQNVARQGIINRLGISTTDETNRIGQLANLSSSEQSLGQYNKTLEGKQSEFNINNLIQEQQGKRGYDDMTYQEQMKKWAAGRQADATARSGGGGGK